VGEADWYPKLVAEGHRWGWLVEHHRTVQTATGHHMTAILGDKGWVDFVFSHPHRHVTIFREIKATKGKPSEDQLRWMASLRQSGLDVAIWTLPADWPRAVALLSFGQGVVEPELLLG
jgi:hypothetical protein